MSFTQLHVSEVDSDKSAEHTEHARFWGKKRGKSNQTKDGQPSRLTNAVRAFLPRSRAGQPAAAAVHDNDKPPERDVMAPAEGASVGDPTVFDLAIDHLFEETVRLVRTWRPKNKLKLDSLVLADTCSEPRAFSPTAEASLAYEQVRLDGHTCEPVLYIKLRVAIKWPYVLDRSVPLTIWPNEPMDFTIQIRFFDHPSPGKADNWAVLSRGDEIEGHSMYRGYSYRCNEAASGIILSFCRGCDGFEGGYNADCRATGQNKRHPFPTTPADVYLLACVPQARTGQKRELVKPLALKDHHRIVAQCAIKVTFARGRYTPKLHAWSTR